MYWMECAMLTFQEVSRLELDIHHLQDTEGDIQWVVH